MNKTPAFSAIVKRHKTRVDKLNDLLKDELQLPSLAESESTEK